MLVEWLFEAGPVMPGGMGDAPLTWQELRAWSRMVAIPLQPWESQFIVRLSREYALEQALAADEDRPPPWGDTDRAAARREAVDKAVRASLGGMARAEPNQRTIRKRKKP